MGLSTDRKSKNFIIDAIHGDIHLTPKEIKVIDTPTFQRLRQIKQLQMSHLTYPNATHTRFMHSLGVLGIMIRVQQVAQENGISLEDEEIENLRLAALLHDIGHYPYSHLLEGIEAVNLIEKKVYNSDAPDPQKILPITPDSYPEHEEVGFKIVTSQPDIIEAIGGAEKARKVADLFSGQAFDVPQSSKLISSSLDLDRLDYLQRDAYATGLPYGKIDLNYLLNSLQMSQTGEIGVCERAIPAVEHYLLARYFMHRTVYCHRTTVAFEEACRQLLRRLRDQRIYSVPEDGNQIEAIITSPRLLGFTDAFIDNIIQEAATDDDEVIRSLAGSIQSRNAPKLLKEVLVLEEKTREHHSGATFKNRCYRQIKELAGKHSLPLELFLFYESKQITFEKSESRFKLSEIDEISDPDQKKILKKEKEIVQIFSPEDSEPRSIFDFDYSIIKKLSELEFRICRLYFVPYASLPGSKIDELRAEIKDWEKP